MHWSDEAPPPDGHEVRSASRLNLSIDLTYCSNLRI